MHDRRANGGRTVWKRPGDRAWGPLADDGSGAAGGRGVLRLMVLAAAGVARLPRGDSGHVALAMAGSGSAGAWICRGLALRLGFWVDGAAPPRPWLPRSD